MAVKKSKKKSKTLKASDLTPAITNLQADVAKLRYDANWNKMVSEKREAVAARNTQELEKFGKGVTDSMYALREATQKAITELANNIAAVNTRTANLHQQVDRLEERVTLAERFAYALKGAVTGVNHNAGTAKINEYLYHPDYGGYKDED